LLGLADGGSFEDVRSAGMDFHMRRCAETSQERALRLVVIRGIGVAEGAVSSR